ncbi:unnamed protein product [Sphagnum jensenii]|uniref:Uncharacterized protein n=1 Tax=Sphagnum jensenii TaxID=128206 RepID=A0ABP1AYW1_9BRYO
MIVSEKDLEWLRTSTAFSRLVNPELHCQAQSDRGRYRDGDRLSSWLQPPWTSLGLEVGVWWAERKRLNLLLISCSYVPAYVLDGVSSLDPAS